MFWIIGPSSSALAMTTSIAGGLSSTQPRRLNSLRNELDPRAVSQVLTARSIPYEIVRHSNGALDLVVYERDQWVITLMIVIASWVRRQRQAQTHSRPLPAYLRDGRRFPAWPAIFGFLLDEYPPAVLDSTWRLGGVLALRRLWDATAKAHLYFPKDVPHG